ncbi:transposase [Alkalibacter rhizosphaerae]|uniref:Transposase n=1 Tax=Alkalibacter rhizosphaerae TaxID=2815577 RepID=A0A975AHS2_9FIRM|nr:transposase [Alkalibacter rhizosphaerae]QSX07914.1 transposase [Alkalibacter rhizosphaerae]
MARIPRKECKSRYYHILVEGRTDKDIFADPSDKEKMLEIMERVLEESNVSVYAYCIMDNHAHFIVQEGEGDISRFMKRINGSYAVYYNRKYGERGQVFYDRFKSENIRDMEHLMRVMRFIHNNPVNSGSVPKQRDYPWSSYRQYVLSIQRSSLLKKEHILVWFSRDQKVAMDKFVVFMQEKSNDIYLDLEESIEKTVQGMIRKYLTKNHLQLEELGYKENVLHRDRLIQLVREVGGFSIRKIADLLQLNRGTVYNVLSRSNKPGEERND